MKSLVCEMCGGNNLIKQEGVFVCQNCKTKYSVEEAKRMMIESTVDVTGSVVKANNSTKLENLYKVARRAWNDGDITRASKSYEQLLVEDPDNWEPNFYAAYFSGMNCLKNDKPGGSVRISGGQVKLSYDYRSGLEPCISRIHNCIDSVFSFIEDIEDYSEQKSAADRVHEDVTMAASNLLEIIDTEHARMKREIAHYISETNEEGSIVGRGMDSYTMNGTNNMNRDSYKRDVSDMIALVESREAKLEEVISKRRIEKYWADNPAEKAALESEKQSLSNQIASLENEITEIPGYTNMSDLSKQSKLLEAQKSSLGVFKGKEKKTIQAQIDSLNNQIEQIKIKIRPFVENIKSRIQPLESRLESVNTELTKSR